MFVRKKPNKSGVVSIQIIDKSSGKYVVRKTIGSSVEKTEIDFLVKKAKREILFLSKQSLLPFDEAAELEFVDSFVNSIESFSLIGPELLLGRLFDEIGLNAIADELFRHLVITRLVYPVSKLKTADYLFKYKGTQISVYSIYRYLDRLHQNQIKQVKEISLQHTLDLFGHKISLVFYDVTTLYFEASKEDDLRKMGFSKDGKHQQPQIVLGLLVSQGGYPLDYDIFEGNKYEGETLLPVLEQFEEKYSPEQLIVIADAGLLSHHNIELLKEKGYQYILGGRIKNETTVIKQQALDLKLTDNQSHVIQKEDARLIVSYKHSRALKDAHNRKRGLEKLEKSLASGKLSKKNINNKGYNKYLKLEGEVTIKIDYERYDDDAKWDGLKAYLTNTQLPKEQVIEKYNQLWNIEQTFRISKSDLQMRPVYHRLRKRIEAHICISFAACKIYKELERQLKKRNSKLSPEKVIDILKTIYKVTIQTPHSNRLHQRLVLKTQEQKDLIALFNLQI
ncbi:MAG TPA: IS1634 family transposase [Chitinophagaceae bacterium]|nr:IS1634 family transposase [Chitinophagaceae bacterium]